MSTGMPRWMYVGLGCGVPLLVALFAAVIFFFVYLHGANQADPLKRAETAMLVLGAVHFISGGIL